MESLHFLLMKSHTLLQKKISAEAAKIGLSPGQPKILDYLYSHEGSDQKTIASYCEIEQATCGSLLLRMEQADLIVRRQAAGNRRSLYVYLSEKGKLAADRMQEIFRDTEREALSHLDEESTEQLKQSLLALCRHMKGEDKDE